MNGYDLSGLVENMNKIVSQAKRDFGSINENYTKEQAKEVMDVFNDINKAAKEANEKISEVNEILSKKR